jgi:hypothetical protein
MFFIRKYADCWAVHNDDTGESRPLTEQEQKDVQEEFPSLLDEQVRSIFMDNIRCLGLPPSQPIRPHKGRRRGLR